MPFPFVKVLPQEVLVAGKQIPSLGKKSKGEKDAFQKLIKKLEKDKVQSKEEKKIPSGKIPLELGGDCEAFLADKGSPPAKTQTGQEKSTSEKITSGKTPLQLPKSQLKVTRQELEAPPKVLVKSQEEQGKVRAEQIRLVDRKEMPKEEKNDSAKLETRPKEEARKEVLERNPNKVDLKEILGARLQGSTRGTREKDSLPRRSASELTRVETRKDYFIPQEKVFSSSHKGFLRATTKNPKLLKAPSLVTKSFRLEGKQEKPLADKGNLLKKASQVRPSLFIKEEKLLPKNLEKLTTNKGPSNKVKNLAKPLEVSLEETNLEVKTKPTWSQVVSFQKFFDNEQTVKIARGPQLEEQVPLESQNPLREKPLARFKTSFLKQEEGLGALLEDLGPEASKEKGKSQEPFIFNPLKSEVFTSKLKKEIQLESLDNKVEAKKDKKDLASPLELGQGLTEELAAPKELETKAFSVQRPSPPAPEEIMDQVIAQVHLAKVENGEELEVKLKPDYLGGLKVKLALEEGQLRITFLADSPLVREVLEANLDSLKSHLQQEGFNSQGLEVNIQGDSPGNQGRKDTAYKHEEEEIIPNLQESRLIKERILNDRQLDYRI